MPTINEMVGMKAILPRIKREWVDEIIVVDKDSTDGTPEFAQQMGCITVKQKSRGLGGAYYDALEVATGDIIITFSPDGNSVPEIIPELVRKMNEGYDMVIVSRYLPGVKSEDDDWLTRIGNWMFTRIINVLFRAHYTDTLVMFRAWTRKLYMLERINDTVGGPEPHLCIVAARHRLKVADIPGDEPKRIGDVRKMRPFANGSAIVWLIVKEFLFGGARQKP